MQIYNLIPEGMYKELAQLHNLNGFWRTIFRENETVEDYESILNETHNVRQAFMDLQPKMLQDLRIGLVGSLPLIFIRDRASSSGASFLRWRNLKNTKSGQQAWENIVTDHQYPTEIRQALLKVEKERIALNMQISILSYIIRQASECKSKLEYIEKLSNQK
ncbi:DUF3158 family protein [Pasteurella oralis]|uniref:DUF3158 family protein n=1 Tax=Pasteurella oralis TaxID=1071947 RepID=UPI000C7DDC89|nr:DUF3158 family protein [Pasteurella oralis]